MWKYQLIALYTAVCDVYRNTLAPIVQRLSNNYNPAFTDEELMTVYLWGVMQQQIMLKAIYRYTKNHLLDWFPKLPSYQAFNRRLGEMAPAFELLSAIFMERLHPGELSLSDTGIIDSLPVMLAKNSRSSHGKVAQELCSKSYCSSKGQWYYGMKLHVLGIGQVQSMPLPAGIFASNASEHDLPVAKDMIERLNVTRCSLFGDKAYSDTNWQRELLFQRAIKLYTPQKRVRGQVEVFPGPDTVSRFISSVRQPIECFFNWLNEKTGIQVASKVRSTKGLLVHIFGRLAAAFASLLFLSHP